MTLVRIEEVTPLESCRVRLKLSDGRTVELDLSPWLSGPMFAEIRSRPEYFRKIRAESGTLVWPNGADLCPDTVIWGGLPPADAADDAA
jgi:hypothetical protein